MISSTEVASLSPVTMFKWITEKIDELNERPETKYKAQALERISGEVLQAMQSSFGNNGGQLSTLFSESFAFFEKRDHIFDAYLASPFIEQLIDKVLLFKISRSPQRSGSNERLAAKKRLFIDGDPRLRHHPPPLRRQIGPPPVSRTNANLSLARAAIGQENYSSEEDQREDEEDRLLVIPKKTKEKTNGSSNSPMAMWPFGVLGYSRAAAPMVKNMEVKRKPAKLTADVVVPAVSSSTNSQNEQEEMLITSTSTSNSVETRAAQEKMAAQCQENQPIAVEENEEEEDDPYLRKSLRGDNSTLEEEDMFGGGGGGEGEGNQQRIQKVTGKATARKKDEQPILAEKGTVKARAYAKFQAEREYAAENGNKKLAEVMEVKQEMVEEDENEFELEEVEETVIEGREKEGDQRQEGEKDSSSAEEDNRDEYEEEEEGMDGETMTVKDEVAGTEDEGESGDGNGQRREDEEEGMDKGQPSPPLPEDIGEAQQEEEEGRGSGNGGAGGGDGGGLPQQQLDPLEMDSAILQPGCRPYSMKKEYLDSVNANENCGCSRKRGAAERDGTPETTTDSDDFLIHAKAIKLSPAAGAMAANDDEISEFSQLLADQTGSSSSSLLLNPASSFASVSAGSSSQSANITVGTNGRAFSSKIKIRPRVEYEAEQRELRRAANKAAKKEVRFAIEKNVIHSIEVQEGNSMVRKSRDEWNNLLAQRPNLAVSKFLKQPLLVNSSNKKNNNNGKRMAAAVAEHAKANPRHVAVDMQDQLRKLVGFVRQQMHQLRKQEAKLDRGEPIAAEQRVGRVSRLLLADSRLGLDQGAFINMAMFQLDQHRDINNLTLAMDNQCRFIKDHLDTFEFSYVFIFAGFNAIQENGIVPARLDMGHRLSDWFANNLTGLERRKERNDEDTTYLYRPPQVVLITLPEVGMYTEAIKKYNQGLRKVVETDKKGKGARDRLLLLDWATLIKRGPNCLPAAESSDEDRVKLLVDKMNKDFGVLVKLAA